MKEKSITPSKGIIIKINLPESVNVSIGNRAIVIYREEMTIVTLTKLATGILKEGSEVTITLNKNTYSLS